PVLLGMARQCLPEEAAAHWLWLPSLRESRRDDAQILESVAALHANGVRIDWSSFYQPHTHQKVALPGYPFQRQRFWAAPRNTPSPGAADQDAATLPGRRIYSPAFTHGEVQFELDQRAARRLHDQHAGARAPLDAVYLDLAQA